METRSFRPWSGAWMQMAEFAGGAGGRRWAEGYALLPVRLLVGFGFLQHGLAKWMKGPEAFAGLLHAIGVPAPHLMAMLTIATEMLVGVAVLLGAFVAWVSVPGIIVMLVAMLSVHLPYGFSSIKLV